MDKTSHSLKNNIKLSNEISNGYMKSKLAQTLFVQAIDRYADSPYPQI